MDRNPWNPPPPPPPVLPREIVSPDSPVRVPPELLRGVRVGRIGLRGCLRPKFPSRRIQCHHRGVLEGNRGCACARLVQQTKRSAGNPIESARDAFTVPWKSADNGIRITLIDNDPRRRGIVITLIAVSTSGSALGRAAGTLPDSHLAIIAAALRGWKRAAVPAKFHFPPFPFSTSGGRRRVISYLPTL
jgi:hypothetical protein